MKHRMFLLVVFLGFLAKGPAQAADFAVGFQGCPSVVEGETVGEVKTFTVFATVTTTNNPPPADGAQGWSLSIEATGWTIDAVTLKGVTVDTYYCEDDDGDPGTPCIEHPSYIQDLGDATVFTKIANKATWPDDANRKGVISAVVLRGQEKMVLQPEGTQTILKLTLSATIPEGGTCVDHTIAFVDGFKSSVSQPVKNVVTFGGASITPVKNNCTTCVKQKVVQPEYKLAVIPEGETPTFVGGDVEYAKDVTPGDVQIPVFVYLQTENLPAGDGPQGWSLSIANEACTTVGSVTLKGVTVNTHYCEDDDADPGTPCIDHPDYVQDLGAPEVFTKIANKADGSPPSPINDANQKGVISAVVLRGQELMVLKANATDHILKIVYNLTVAEGQTVTCKSFILDGLKSSVSQPVKNVITYQGGSKTPTVLQNLVLKLTGVTGPKKDGFARGDANDDGKFNIADAVRVVMAVTGGASLRCIDAGDADGNSRLEIPDCIFLIDWQFRTGPAPGTPFPACGTTEKSTPETCPADTTRCPPPT